jgi:hypothetical protein
LVHQATKAERQLQQDAKNNKPLSYGARTMTRGSKSISRFIVAPSASKGITGGLRSNIQGNASGKNVAAPIMGPKSVASTSTLVGSTSKSSGIQCFKCGGHGHVIKECPNNRVILVNDDKEYTSASEEEAEVGNVDDTDKVEEHTRYEFENDTALVATQILSVQMKDAKIGQ